MKFFIYLFVVVVTCSFAKTPLMKVEVKETKELFQTNNQFNHYFEDFSIDLFYGYQFMTLDVDTEVHSLSDNGNTQQITLSEGGSYKFDSISLEYKKINMSIYDYTFSYEIVDNKREENGKTFLEEQTVVYIEEIIGGYTSLEHPNIWLNHLSRFQFLKRDAKFSGFYEKNGKPVLFEMDKTRYSFQNIFSVNHAKLGDKYTYFRLDYEKSELPMVIYAANGAVDFVDDNFQTDKFIILIGEDAISFDGLIYGSSFGLGLSNTNVSSSAKKIIDAAGIELGSSLSFNYQFEVKVGYHKIFNFNYTQVEVGVLCDVEYFREVSNDVDPGNGNITLVYDRSEIMGTFKFNTRISF